MTNQVYALILAAGVTAGTTLWDTIINLITDPPSVVCDGEWVAGCNRVVGGLDIEVVNAPDVSFSFEGLSTEVPLGYQVLDVESNQVLFSGEGVWVPLTLAPGNARVRFYALSGEVDWTEVSTVSATSQAPQMALPMTVSESPSQGTTIKCTCHLDEDTFISPIGSYKITVTVPEDEAEKTADFSLFGVSSGTETVYADDFRCEAICPYFMNACEIAFSGVLDVPVRGGYEFAVQADDAGSIAIGERTISASLNNPSSTVVVDLEAGQRNISGTFSSIGGPYHFGVEPFGRLAYRLVEAGSLTVSPTTIVVPWEKDGSTTGTINVVSPTGGQCSAIVNGEVQIEAPSFVSAATGGLSVNHNDFFRGWRPHNNGNDFCNAVVWRIWRGCRTFSNDYNSAVVYGNGW